MTVPDSTADLAAFTFDLDDTLVEYERSPGEVLDAAFERADVDPCFTGADYRGAYGDYAADADSVEALRRACFADLAADAGRDPAVGERVAAAFTAERDQTRVDPLPGARALLDAVRDSGRGVALVTNGAPEMQRRKLAGAGLADAFDAVVFAGYDAPAKPDPAPFHRALDALDVPAASAAHVGDSLSSDVAGARAAGLRSVWTPATHDTPDPEPDHAFPDLHAVADWLRDA